MRMHYDYDAGRYVGERVSVDEWTFLRALQALILAGWEPEAALDLVLEEKTWSSTTNGVAMLPLNPICRCCGQTLAPPRQGYCNAACEATAYLTQVQQTW